MKKKGFHPNVSLIGWSDKEINRLNTAIGTLFIDIIFLSSRTQTNLPEAAKAKIKKNAVKYPVNRAYGSSKSYRDYKEVDGKLVVG